MQSNKSFSLKELKEDLKRLLKKYPEVYDFYIFGSAVKGKENPSDIDIAMIAKEKKFNLSVKILSELKNYHNLHLETFLLKEIFTEPVWKSLLSEGFSVRKDKFIRDLMNVKSNIIYTYNLKNLNQSEKTMFNRACRNKLSDIGGRQLSPGSIDVPLENEKDFDDLFLVWGKIKVQKLRVLVL